MTTDDPEQPNIRRRPETFGGGFSETRSLTHPYLVKEIHPSIWMLDEATRRAGTYGSRKWSPTTSRLDSSCRSSRPPSRHTW